jgi:hypothetical protein
MNLHKRFLKSQNRFFALLFNTCRFNFTQIKNMNIYNFTNKGQGEFYDSTRPNYTNEMFEHVLNSHKGHKENYLDIACGTGQVIS